MSIFTLHLRAVRWEKPELPEENSLESNTLSTADLAASIHTNPFMTHLPRWEIGWNMQKKVWVKVDSWRKGSHGMGSSPRAELRHPSAFAPVNKAQCSLQFRAKLAVVASTCVREHPSGASPPMLSGPLWKGGQTSPSLQATAAHHTWHSQLHQVWPDNNHLLGEYVNLFYYWCTSMAQIC